VALAHAACSTAPRSDGYERHGPEETLLYQLVEQHWPAFRERAEQSGGLPRFVLDEFEAYLRCGILEHGFAHFACRRCGQSQVVAWSCKRRGFCPSCIGGRMSDCAAHLVDEVLPKLRWRSLRRRAKRTCDLSSVEDAQLGALTFMQRADSSPG
jgi:hypothetical protein